MSAHSTVVMSACGTIIMSACGTVVMRAYGTVVMSAYGTIVMVEMIESVSLRILYCSIKCPGLLGLLGLLGFWDVVAKTLNPNPACHMGALHQGSAHRAVPRAARPTPPRAASSHFCMPSLAWGEGEGEGLSQVVGCRCLTGCCPPMTDRLSDSHD